MSSARICIQYKPQIYADCFKRIIESLGVGQVLDLADISRQPESELNQLDLVVLALGANGKPELPSLFEHCSRARMVAFSPDGDSGVRRAAGGSEWEIVHPFGL